MAAILRTLACIAGLALGVILLAAASDATRLPPGGRAVPVLVVVVGWGFTGVGAYTWRRREDNPIGALMTAFGLLVLMSGLVVSDTPWLYLLSIPADSLALAVFVHLLLAFPDGRLHGQASRVVAAGEYVVGVVAQGLALLLADPAEPGCADCPRNPLAVARHEGLVDVALAVEAVVAPLLAVAALVIVVRRRSRASAIRRRAFAPLALAGAVVLALALVSIAAQSLEVGDGPEKAAQLVFIAAFATLPGAFLAGLLRTRFFRTAAAGRVIDRLGQGGDEVREALIAALGDPSLALAYWLPNQSEYVDRDGRTLAVPPRNGGAAATEIRHQGRRVGALLHDPSLNEDRELVRAATSAAALALENERLTVELRAQLEALRQSRTRIVEAGDAERRRLGRDLHDGAQQRLISLLIELQLARERFDSQPGAARELVDRALENARAAVEELRELASGIHPAVLSQRGLEAGIEALAARSPVPVELDVRLDDRLPAPLESAAYFVVAEALTNVAKYAQATYARVEVRRKANGTVVEVRDDGVGGAVLDRGSGLRGLEDRVGARGGTLEVDSPPGSGTLLRARFPG